MPSLVVSMGSGGWNEIGPDGQQDQRAPWPQDRDEEAARDPRSRCGQHGPLSIVWELALLRDAIIERAAVGVPLVCAVRDVLSGGGMSNRPVLPFARKAQPEQPEEEMVDYVGMWRATDADEAECVALFGDVEDALKEARWRLNQGETLYVGRGWMSLSEWNALKEVPGDFAFPTRKPHDHR